MSERFHISQDGNPRQCSAEIGKCPFGEHYPSIESARKAFEDSIEKKLSDSKETVAEFLNISRECESLEGKLHAWTDYALQKFDGPISNEGRIALNSLFQDFRKKNNELRRTFQKARLEEQYLIDSGLRAGSIISSIKINSDWVDRNSRFYSWMKNMNIYFDDSSLEDPEIRELLIKELSSWAEISREEASSRIDDYFESENSSKDAHIVSLFQEASDWKKDRVYVDLETTGFDPRIGEIIEIGIVRVNSNGDIVDTVNQRFDLENPEFRDKIGTGPQHVHNISPQDISGLPTFSNPEVQEKISRILNDENIVLVAHNANFENIWLSQHLDGFWEAHDSLSGDSLYRGRDLSVGVPSVLTQDTRVISALLQETKSNRLQDFAPSNGVSKEEYEKNSHGAFSDSEMTFKALENFKKKLISSRIGERPLADSY